MNRLTGVAASRGIAIGPVFQFRRAHLVIEQRTICEPAEEWKRFEAAIETARTQLTAIYEKALKESGSEQAEIFQFHLLMLDDASVLDGVRQAIDERRVNVEFALGEVAATTVASLKAMESEYFQERAADVMDVVTRLQRILLGVAETPTANLKVPSVIVSDDLTPSDTILLDKSLVLGFCTAAGSATAHMAILARGLGLPAVAGAGASVLAVSDGAVAVVDGTSGEAILDADAATVSEYRLRQNAAARAQTEALKTAHQPAVTTDGRHFEIAANIGNVEGARSAVEAGAEGVGLLRTEFLYMDRTTLPDEEEQFQSYIKILDVFGQMPVVLRTLDIGGDKELPYLKLAPEMNPFLGVRALRLCLAQPELFKPQLRAALRASAGHNLKIMYPMVATVSEVRRARVILEECRAELKAAGKPVAENIEIGIMVEIPSAAVCADQLAREVDFFSIGTNDLSQYTLAADRGNPAVAELSNAFQPSVLRLIRSVIQASHTHGKWTGMCGELAGEPLAAPLLVGLGLDEFSMSPPMVPVIKQIIRGINAAEMAPLAAEALELDSPEDIQALVRQRVPAVAGY